MNQYQTISDLKDYAKEQLTGRYGGAIIVCLIPTLVTVGLTSLVTMLSSTVSALTMMLNGYNVSAAAYSAVSYPEGAGIALSLGSYLFSQVVSLFTGVFSTGTALYFLNMACSRPAAVSNLFYGFQHCFKKSLTISLVLTLVKALCFVPYNIASFLGTTNRNPWFLAAVGICLTVGAAVYLPIAFGLSQSYFLLLDFPQYSPKEILRHSMRLMKGRKRQLFFIELSFLPLLMLSVLSFGIGELWVTSYLNMTMALYYLDLMKPKEAV